VMGEGAVHLTVAPPLTVIHYYKPNRKPHTLTSTQQQPSPTTTSQLHNKTTKSQQNHN
jgi:hypothetical protein